MGQEEDDHRAHVIGWVPIHIISHRYRCFDERDGIPVSRTSPSSFCVTKVTRRRAKTAWERFPDLTPPGSLLSADGLTSSTGYKYPRSCRRVSLVISPFQCNSNCSAFPDMCRTHAMFHFIDSDLFQPQSQSLNCAGSVVSLHIRVAHAQDITHNVSLPGSYCQLSHLEAPSLPNRLFDQKRPTRAACFEEGPELGRRFNVTYGAMGRDIPVLSARMSTKRRPYSMV
jgi:hypothetical protein